MFYSLLDLIICPACRQPLTVLAPTEQSQRTTMRMKPAHRAMPAGAIVGPLPEPDSKTALWQLLSPLTACPATDGRDRETSVVQGILVCVYCERWYPIRNGLPELLPDYLRRWEKEWEWLMAYQSKLISLGLKDVLEILWVHERPGGQVYEDQGVHYKKAEMAVTERNLPEEFFGPAAVAPFNPSNPNFSIDLLACFVTTASRLGCGMNGVVFDLGCGFAWTTEWLVRLGYQAIGADICRDYVLAGLPRMGNNLPHLIVGDVENLPLRDECVDAVLSFESFHHVPNRRRAMQELARIMRAGTRIVLIEPGIEHEKHPRSVAAMKQHGILERGFDRAGLASYIQDTALGNIAHFRSDVHPHDIFTVLKAGNFETDSLAPRALVAEMIVQPEQGCIAVGCQPEITVTITNRGDTIWLNSTPDGLGEVHLGAQLFDTNHTLLKDNYARALLPRTIRPRQRIKIRCTLPPIQKPGNYIVELDMVDNDFLWFKDYTFQPVPWPLKVVSDGEETKQTDKDWSFVPKAAPRIVSVELAFDPNPVDVLHPTRKTPLLHFPRVVWQVLKTEGLVALGRKIIARLGR